MGAMTDEIIFMRSHTDFKFGTLQYYISVFCTDMRDELIIKDPLPFYMSEEKYRKIIAECIHKRLQHNPDFKKQLIFSLRLTADLIDMT